MARHWDGTFPLYQAWVGDCLRPSLLQRYNALHQRLQKQLPLLRPFRLWYNVLLLETQVRRSILGISNCLLYPYRSFLPIRASQSQDSPYPQEFAKTWHHWAQYSLRLGFRPCQLCQLLLGKSRLDSLLHSSSGHWRLCLFSGSNCLDDSLGH